MYLTECVIWDRRRPYYRILTAILYTAGYCKVVKCPTVLSITMKIKAKTSPYDSWNYHTPYNL